MCLISKDEKWNKLIFYNQLLLLSSSVEQGVSQSSKPLMSGTIRRKTGFKKECENLFVHGTFCLLFSPCSWELFDENLMKK